MPAQACPPAERKRSTFGTTRRRGRRVHRLGRFVVSHGAQRSGVIGGRRTALRYAACLTPSVLILDGARLGLFAVWPRVDFPQNRTGGRGGAAGVGRGPLRQAQGDAGQSAPRGDFQSPIPRADAPTSQRRGTGPKRPFRRSACSTHGRSLSPARNALAEPRSHGHSKVA